MDNKDWEDAIKEMQHTKQFYVSQINFDLAIEALEKQIPKKPIKTYYADEEVDSGTDYHCPNCNLIVGAYSDDMQEWIYSNDYCSDCGQKIDWNIN